MQRPFFLNVLILLIATMPAVAQPAHVFTVRPNSILGKIEPTMYGVFFEDINLGADGGIYAELIKNRSFEFFKPLMGWTVERKNFVEGDLVVLNRMEESPANPRYIRVSIHQYAPGDLGLRNEGFRGMGIKEGLQYDFSVLYRAPKEGVRLLLQLQDSTGKAIGSTEIPVPATGGQWKKLATSFNALATVAKGRFDIQFVGSGTVDLDMISLFPSDTWKNRPGGLRADMVQWLADMKPGFIRFPGGCIVEGHDLALRYQWKKTIGPVEQRQMLVNRWNYEFAHRPAPDYYQSFGLGFFEYFQLAEDIGAQPLPILNCGMACQFNSAETVPLEELGPYVQDALDLVEFANGDTNTKWGRVRADMGHPASFGLKMLGVGNENWGPQYLERLKVFYKAIHKKYPDIKLVTSSGTDPNGERFDLLNRELRAMNVDIIDEHYYRRPEWFFENARRYDSYPRSGPSIFAGEYAAQSDRTVSINNRNNWLTALSEAAFLTGLERNAAVVHMASYAPLFAHVDGWQWTPDLIWVDNLRSYGTPNYYIQQLFSLNKGEQVVPILLGNEAIAGQDSLYASASVQGTTHELILKIVNASSGNQSIKVKVEGVKNLAPGMILTRIETPDLQAENSFAKPRNIAPVTSAIERKGKNLSLQLPPYSVSVYRVKMQ